MPTSQPQSPGDPNPPPPPPSPPRLGSPSSQSSSASSTESVRVAVGSVSSGGGNDDLNEPGAPPNNPAEHPAEFDIQEYNLRDHFLSSNPDDGPVTDRLLFDNETRNTMYGQESSEEMEERARREAEHRASQAIQDYNTKFSSTPDD